MGRDMGGMAWQAAFSACTPVNHLHPVGGRMLLAVSMVRLVPISMWGDGWHQQWPVVAAAGQQNNGHNSMGMA